MRFLVGLISGLIGLLAGWSALAALVVALSGPDRDGGIAMGAFFNIGPVGGVIGLIAGIWLFNRFGVARDGAPSSGPSVGTPAPRARLSFPFAVSVLLIVAGLAYWTWHEFIRSPYLSHGFMTLDLQFRLPSGMNLAPERADVGIVVMEGNHYVAAELNRGWHGHDGDRQVMLASASLSYKARHRAVSFILPGGSGQSWQLDLSADPDPTPGYTAWRPSDSRSSTKIEMSYRLRADRED